MPRKDLVSQGVSKLMDAIADGTFTFGQALPRETDLAEYLDSSRSTMREAVRTLAERGVLSVQHGRGTFVEPLARWRDLESIIAVVSRDLEPAQVGAHLVEIRRMIEVGSAGHAAERASAEDIEKMEDTLQKYDLAVSASDTREAAKLDIQFHNLIMRATGNPFVAAIFEPLQQALLDSRVLTTDVEDVRTRAQAHHWNILKCIKDGDPQGAKDAMRAHMEQTANDIARYL